MLPILATGRSARFLTPTDTLTGTLRGERRRNAPFSTPTVTGTRRAARRGVSSTRTPTGTSPRRNAPSSPSPGGMRNGSGRRRCTGPVENAGPAAGGVTTAISGRLRCLGHVGNAAPLPAEATGTGPPPTGPPVAKDTSVHPARSVSLGQTTGLAALPATGAEVSFLSMAKRNAHQVPQKPALSVRGLTKPASTV